MKRLLIAIICFSVSGLGASHATPLAHEAAIADDGISVYFSPKGGCTVAIVEQLAKAQKTIDVMAYSFTSTEIIKAVADAHERGVKVRVILDARTNDNGKYSGATYLFNHGVPTYTDHQHAIAHNKVIIIDGETVITGSFNFSAAAENSNAENLIILAGRPKIAATYSKNFEDHLSHSGEYAGVRQPVE